MTTGVPLSPTDPTTTTTSTTPTGPSTIPCPVAYGAPADSPRAGANAKVNLVRVGPAHYQLSGTVSHDSLPPVYPPTIIVLDRLVVIASYGSEKRTFEVAVAGHRLSPGAQATFDVPDSGSSRAPTTFFVADFDYHCST